MGELAALVSALCFGASNITIIRGADARTSDNGAFLSIVMTAALAGIAAAVFAPPAAHDRTNAVAIGWFALSGLLTLFIGRVFVFASVQYLGAVRAAAIKRLNPVFSVILGILLLGETLDGAMTVGMALIFGSFGLLAAEAWHSRPARLAGSRLLANPGYLYGPVSALAYATGNLARKQGLAVTPDPNFGTMIGAITGVLVFLGAALVLKSYRGAVRSTFSRWNPWLFGAALLASMGQIMQFLALNYITVSRVALVTSTEVVFTMILARWLLRTIESLTRTTALAAIMSVIGAALVIGF